MHVKPIEETIDNVKKNLKEHEMGYDIVEDIKKDKANISMFDTLEEGSLKQEEISETNVTTRSQGLVK